MNRTFTFSTILLALSVYQASAQSDWVKRVAVFRPPEMDAVSVQSVKYKERPAEQSLSMDLYYPIGFRGDTTYPAVIFVLGYPDSTILRMDGSKYKDVGQYTSWGRLVASVGLIGISYETQQPNVDLDDLLSFLQAKGAALGIDSRRIGLWSCSGNVPTAISALSEAGHENVKCAALLYGTMQTPDRKFQFQIDSLSVTAGFYSRQLEPVNEIRRDFPFFIIRAGRERIRYFNETIDHFVSQAVSVNAPVTLINYANGRHGFDVFDDNEESRYIIQETLAWLKSNLMGK